MLEGVRETIRAAEMGKELAEEEASRAKATKWRTMKATRKAEHEEAASVAVAGGRANWVLCQHAE